MLALEDMQFSYVRRLRRDDIAQLIEWDRDPQLSALAGRKFEAGNEMAWWRNLRDNRSRAGFAIVNEHHELIGDIELEQITWRTGEAELRVSIGNKLFWGKGIGPQAIHEILHMAFSQMQLKRIYLRVQASNVRAIRAYSKVGFKKTARLEANGRLVGQSPMILMEITRNYFNRLKA